MAEEVKAPVSEAERAEIPWVMAYRREDIQDLRNEIREARRSIESLRNDMTRQLRWTIGITITTMVAMTGIFAWIVNVVLR